MSAPNPPDESPNEGAVPLEVDPHASTPVSPQCAESVRQNRCPSCNQHVLIGKLQAYAADLERQVGQLRASLAENSRIFGIIANDDGSRR